MKPFIFTLIALFALGCLTGSAQKDNVPGKKKPHEEIKVNKKYDDKGNLTSYDSTYVYSWSGDSTMTGFPEGFDANMFMNWNKSFGADSAFFNMPFGNMFGSDDPFKGMMDQFSQIFSDSVANQVFSFHGDSLFTVPNDSTTIHEFHFGNNDFEKQFGKHYQDSIMSHFFSGFGNNTFFFGTDSLALKQQKMIREQMKDMEKRHREIFDRKEY